MNLPFTLRQLEVFSSLCATRSFRRTAESLGVSQASVSNQVKALEHQLGFALFDRRPGRRPALTVEGVAFEEDFLVFRSAAEALAQHRRRTAEDMQQSVRYRVLVGQGLLDNFIRAELGQFHAANPQIELAFEARPPSEGLARDLESGLYDFALIHRRAAGLVEPYLRPLALVRGGIYGSPQFAEGRTLPLPADVVNTLPFVMPVAASAPERDMLQFLERFGIRPQRIVGHTQYYDVMAAMLEKGLGVASFADPILPPAMRDTVVLLHPLENWRLLWFRKDAGSDPRCDAVQAFLWSRVIGNPDYLTVDTFVDRQEWMGEA